MGETLTRKRGRPARPDPGADPGQARECRCRCRADSLQAGAYTDSQEMNAKRVKSVLVVRPVADTVHLQLTLEDSEGKTGEILDFVMSEEVAARLKDIRPPLRS